MLSSILIYETNLIKNNFIYYKVKLKNIVKKYQPLRLVIYLISIMLLHNVNLVILSFKTSKTISSSPIFNIV